MLIRSRYNRLSLSAVAAALVLASAPTAHAANPTAVNPDTIDQAYAESLAGSGNLIVVSTSIQAAVNAANAGDVIFVPPGIYTENVTVRTSGLTIVGPRTAVLDGTGLSGPTGIDVRPAAGVAQVNGFNLVGLTIQDYQRNGVRLSATDHYQLLSTKYTDNLQYGLFPVRSTNGLIEGNDVSGANDTGIYVGQSHGAVIRNNTAFANTIGIEIENSTGIDATGNITRDNTIGIFSVVLPGLSVTMSEMLNMAANQVLNNNRPNPVTDPLDVLSRLPSGVGMLFLATDQTTVFGNTVLGNGSVGIGLLSLPPDLAGLDPRINPTPDFNTFVNNTVVGNGTNPDPKLALLGLPAVDLLWDGTGIGNGWRNNRFGTSFPTALPQPVPEPQTWVMLLVGFFGLGALLRRQTKRLAALACRASAPGEPAAA